MVYKNSKKGVQGAVKNSSNFFGTMFPSKKGAQGIGTLIIFIALILVAAVAAGVLISTVGKLQGKAETTGGQVQQKIGTGFAVFEVVASGTGDGWINASNDTITTSLQLSPGSDPIKLNDISVTLVTANGAYFYKYNSTNSSGSTSTFGVSHEKGPVVSGYISKSDTIRINIIAADTIGEDKVFSIRFFPGTGTPLPVKIATPPAMTEAYTVLK